MRFALHDWSEVSTGYRAPVREPDATWLAEDLHRLNGLTGLRDDRINLYGETMKALRSLVLGLTMVLASVAACGDGGGDDDDTGSSAGALTAPSALKATTVDGKPHLTWTDGQNEEHYMIERMDHAVSQEWVAVKGADNLVPNSAQFHDSSAESGKTYMYRVVAMKGASRAVSNEVTWP